MYRGAMEVSSDGLLARCGVARADTRTNHARRVGGCSMCVAVSFSWLSALGKQTWERGDGVGAASSSSSSAPPTCDHATQHS